MLTWGNAQAEGTIEARWLSVSSPQNLWDGLGLGATYQYGSGPQTLNLTTNLDRSSQTLGVNYRRSQHTAQLSISRKIDAEADSRVTSMNGSYTFSPISRTASGSALSAITGLYVFNLNQQTASTTRVQTFGVSLAGRIIPNVTASATGIANIIQANDTTTNSGTISTSISYAKDKTSAAIAANTTVQSTGTTVTLAGGASTELAPNIRGAASASWTAGQKPSASATVTYSIDQWTVGANVTAADAKISNIGANTTVKLPHDINVSGSANYGLQSNTPMFGVVVNSKLVGLNVSAGMNVSLPPQGGPSFGVQASLSGAQKPWQGSLNLNANRSLSTTSGSASGSLAYTTGPFNMRTTLGLNLVTTPANTSSTATTLLTGTADLSASYDLNDRFALSALTRYERSTAADASARYRIGAGLRYRF